MAALAAAASPPAPHVYDTVRIEYSHAARAWRQALELWSDGDEPERRAEALEAEVRYLAFELGPRNIRVNAISAGPVRTLAARSITGFTVMEDHTERNAPLRRNISAEDVGHAALFLCGPLARNVTGQILLVDAGYSILGMSLAPP